MPFEQLHARDVRRLNRRVGWTIVASLLALYALAIIGVLVLN